MAERRKDSMDKFVQSVKSYRFATVLFKREQIDILMEQKNSTKFIRVYMDATAGIIKNPSGIQNMCMNYTIVIPIKTNTVNDEHLLFPVAEMLTNSHKTYKISYAN